MRRIIAAGIVLPVIAGMIFAPGCRREKDEETDSGENVLRLATTTSAVQSGLFDVIIPLFEHKHDVEVRLLVRGSGEALQLGREGKADVVLVHARKLEEAFVAGGYGINRADVMYNDFVIVGPPDDPYGIGEAEGVLEALKRISQQKATFISRGDNSGTHAREMELWNLLGIEPGGIWYVRAGEGMLETCRIASERRAYTLGDISTYLHHRDELDLLMMIEGDPLLFNPYGVIAMNPAVIEGANFEAAMLFIEFVTGIEGQEIIAGYGRLKYGKPLFTPLAVPQD